ncbi:MAG TPA: trigger factor [Casimicrobiaceae bacterium]|nr:trigger factor [Casimicrobiaceae bacterium]
MQTTVETLGALERRLNVALPVADIEGEVQKRLSRLAKTVRVAGFRPGKVPLKMVAQQYGPQVRSDVIADAVQTRFNDAVRSQNLRVAGYPRIEQRNGEGNAESPSLEFSAVFEVYPEVAVGDVSSLAIERPVVTVTAEDVDRTLETLRRQRTTFEPVARAAQAGDRVLVDFTGTIDGVEFPGGQARDFPITLGEGRMLPEFEAAVTGMQAGESKTFSMTFPADYHGKEVAGQVAQFDLHVKQVAEPQLPALDEAFARAFGIASGQIADLRSEVEANLRLELKRKVESVLKDQALKGLRGLADFALPRALIDAEAQGLMQRMAANLREQGMKAEDIKLTPQLFEEQAKERVALGLMVGEVVRREGLQAKPEQVKGLVQEVAQTYEQPEAVVRWHYEKPERLQEFEALAVEKNVVDWVLARARVTDVPTTFEALMAPSQGRSG